MKLGELATVRSGLVLSRKQARKGAPVKMRYPLLSFRAIHPNGYIDMEQLDGFDAAEQLSPEYLTQIGDVIIRLTSPYTAVLIDEASAGMVVSSNFVIIRVENLRAVSAGEKGDGTAPPFVRRKGALLRSADPQCTFDHEMRYAP